MYDQTLSRGSSCRWKVKKALLRFHQLLEGSVLALCSSAVEAKDEVVKFASCRIPSAYMGGVMLT
jgi:hypothetical protein